jgi:hypothetical protein
MDSTIENSQERQAIRQEPRRPPASARRQPPRTPDQPLREPTRSQGQSRDLASLASGKNLAIAVGGPPTLIEPASDPQ